MSVHVIKTKTGEEVLGDVENVTEGYVKVTNPVLVIMQRMQNGETGLGFVPYMPYLAKKEVIFHESDLLHPPMEIDDGLKNQYNGVFGGIVTPPKQLIVG